jgi:cytochrome P450
MTSAASALADIMFLQCVMCRLTDIEITENILLLLLAGHDTSSTTLTRLLSVLHEHPEVVQQLRQEQAAVLARHGEQLTAAAIKDMEYADAVIRCVCTCYPVCSFNSLVRLR